MDNKVGDKVLSAQKLGAIVKQVQAVRDGLRPFGIVLTSAQRKRILRPRKGADAEMQRVNMLALKYGVTVPNVPLDGMQNDLTLAGQMASVVAELAPALTLAEDTAAQADGEAWQAFLAYYGVLASMAARVPELARELAPTVAFMANGPRAATPAAPTPVAAPPAPAPAGGDSVGEPAAASASPAKGPAA